MTGPKFTPHQLGIIAALARGEVICDWFGFYRLSYRDAILESTFQALSDAGFLVKGAPPKGKGMPLKWSISETGAAWAAENL